MAFGRFLERPPALEPVVGGVPVGDLGLAQAPAEERLLPVDNGGEVDEPRRDIPQLDVPLLEAVDAEVMPEHITAKA